MPYVPCLYKEALIINELLSNFFIFRSNGT